MDVNEIHLTHCMLYEFKKGNTAADAVKNICKVYGEHTLDVSKCQQWFSRFQSGILNFPDESRSLELDEEALKALLKVEPRLTNDEIAKRLNSTCTNTHQDLAKTGKLSRFGKWIPHELSVPKCIQRVNICAPLRDRKYNHLNELLPTMKNKLYKKIPNVNDTG
ncbi:histone-lysine N-methyltransferase SETMAR-like [Colletes gigas]|uniref:histone-lysine N-methyltransferase SETMAR-like n=1 Tax=Colletes gigas TaxID=935657 RepID=UPI001C9AB07A|nr:histone-lysine N-methyltransferase SETMAR-like [Colletes gigas]